MTNQLDAPAMAKPYSASPGSKLNSTDAAKWFRVFYKGLENPLYFPFTESEVFETQLPSGWIALPMTTALGIYIL